MLGEHTTMATYAGVLVFSGLSPTDALPDEARPLEAILGAENVRVTTRSFLSSCGPSRCPRQPWGTRVKSGGFGSWGSLAWSRGK